MKGYVVEACPECGNFTRAPNGACLKRDIMTNRPNGVLYAGVTSDIGRRA
jgi:hypothetical protein